MVDDAKCAELEAKLKDNLFIKGAAPSNEDKETIELFNTNKFVPDQEKYPNLWSWYALIVLFEPEVIATWKKEEKPKQEKGKPGKKTEKKEVKKEETKKEDDDDIDLFGEETEEDKKVLEEMKNKNKNKKKPEKDKREKSYVVFEVKGYELEQNLDELAKKIMTFEAEGLTWKTEYQLGDVAFGMKKIIMGMVVIDEVVPVDETLEEVHEKYKDEIQSIDIVSFNKL